MAFPIVPVALGGLSALSKLFGGGGKQTTTFQLSPEQRNWLAQLLKEYPLDVQQAILRQAFAPMISERFRATREMTAPMGSAQQFTGQQMTENDIFNSILQAAIQRQSGIRSDIGGILGRTGTQVSETSQPFGTRLGEGFGDVSESLAHYFGQKMYADILDKLYNPNAQYAGKEDYYGTQAMFSLNPKKKKPQYDPLNRYQDNPNYYPR